jgi:protein-S-isoprenylcysteine O-methyltransferase Ste14
MDIELLFKIIVIIEYIAFSVIRIQFQRFSNKAGYKTIIAESKNYAIGLSIFICYEVLTLFLYLIYPEALSFAVLSLPLSLRLVGILFGIVALALFIWTHKNLKHYFTVMLKIMEGHQIVETGPYRWVRHPMYTAFYLLHIAAFLLTANWFIGLTWTIGLTLVIFSRVRREEEMMLQVFGDRYFAYMQQTGRFMPHAPRFLWPRKKGAL